MGSSKATSVAPALARVGRRFYARGWTLGTSGNFSAVVSRRPLRLAITASAANKGTLRASQVVEVDERGEAVGKGRSRPSAETLLHLEIVRARGAGAVLGVIATRNGCSDTTALKLPLVPSTQPRW